MTYDAAYVRITCQDPPTNLRVLLGDDRVDVSSGYGGWEEVERPGRTTAITWKGLPARRLAVPLLLDDFEAGVSVEGDIRALERLASPRAGGTQPPVVSVTGRGGVIPAFYENKQWVVEALSWGDALMNEHGNRTRQAVTVTLLESISDALIGKPSPAKRRRARSARGANVEVGSGSLRVVAKVSKTHVGRGATTTLGAFDGEDLPTIAARELGDPSRWREIAALNGIRDPRAVRRGQTLRMP